MLNDGGVGAGVGKDGCGGRGGSGGLDEDEEAAEEDDDDDDADDDDNGWRIGIWLLLLLLYLRMMSFLGLFTASSARTVIELVWAAAWAVTLALRQAEQEKGSSFPRARPRQDWCRP